MFRYRSRRCPWCYWSAALGFSCFHTALGFNWRETGRGVRPWFQFVAFGFNCADTTLVFNCCDTGRGVLGFNSLPLVSLVLSSALGCKCCDLSLSQSAALGFTFSPMPAVVSVGATRAASFMVSKPLPLVSLALIPRLEQLV